MNDDLPRHVARLRDLPWMTDATWNELRRPSWRATHLEDIAEFLRPDPTNGRQLLHLISHRMEHSVERVLALGASADEQIHGPGESSTFHPLDRAVGASGFGWSERIAQMLLSAATNPFATRQVRPLLSCAIETPEAVRWCLDKGVDPDQRSERGYTALAASGQSSDKHVDLVVVRQSFRALLDAGADMDTLVPHPNAIDGDPPCMTAAACAAWAQRWPLVRLLVVRGADLDLGGEYSMRNLALREASASALRWLAQRDARALEKGVPVARGRMGGVRL